MTCKVTPYRIFRYMFVKKKKLPKWELSVFIEKNDKIVRKLTKFNRPHRMTQHLAVFRNISHHFEHKASAVLPTSQGSSFRSLLYRGYWRIFEQRFWFRLWNQTLCLLDVFSTQERANSHTELGPDCRGGAGERRCHVFPWTPGWTGSCAGAHYPDATSRFL